MRKEAGGRETTIGHINDILMAMKAVNSAL